MFANDVFLISLFLHGTTKGAAGLHVGTDKSSMTEKDQSFSDKFIDDLLKHVREPIERSHDYKKVYKLIGEAIVERYNITFDEQDEKLVFRSCIPKTFDQRDIDDVISQLVEQNVCAPVDTPKTFQNYVFREKIRIFTECIGDSVNLLIDFAGEKLGVSKVTNPNPSARKFEIVYDPEKSNDANVILTVNWLIKLANTTYDNTFLYNYHISIEEKGACYLYVITFYKYNAYKVSSRPFYAYHAELIKYYEIISKLDFKEMSEKETTSRFLEWAKSNTKSELPICISAYKPFFDNLFDIIRKKRSGKCSNFHYNLKEFSKIPAKGSKENAFFLFSEEKQIIENLDCVTDSSVIFMPSTRADFPYSSGDLSADLSYKDVIARDFHKLLQIAKYANLCFVHKRLRKIIEVLQKHGKAHKTEVLNLANKLLQKIDESFKREYPGLSKSKEEMLLQLISTEKDIANFLDTPFHAHSFILNNQEMEITSDCIPRQYYYYEKVRNVTQKSAIDRFIEVAESQETLVIEMFQNSTSEIATEIKSIRQSRYKNLIENKYNSCLFELRKVSNLCSYHIFSKEKGVEKLKLYEKWLADKEAEIKLMTITDVAGTNDTREVRNLKYEKNVLKCELRAERLNVAVKIDDIMASLNTTCIYIDKLLQVLKKY